MIKSNQTKQWLKYLTMGFPGGSVVKNLTANAGDSGHPVLTPGLGRSPGEESGNPLQYSLCVCVCVSFSVLHIGLLLPSF